MEIKFRAKNKDNGEWEHGYYVKYIKRQVSPIGDFLKETDVIHLIFKSGFADWNMERPLNAVEVVSETVGQFTGKRDKNKANIYSGDILQTAEGDMYRVEFDNNHSAFMAKFYPDDYDSMLLADCCPQKYDLIVGNVYDA